VFDCEIDTSDMERAWDAAAGALAEGITRGVERGVEAGADEARSRHPYKEGTGALTGSIRGYLERAAVRGAGGEAVGVLEAGAKHASWVESGTQPHDIYPKQGQGFVGPLPKGQGRRNKKDIGTHRVALRWQADGQTHFASMVHHPGGKPYPFMGPAVLKAERVIEVEVELAAERVAEIMER
jgi:hypothetical protein